MTHRDCNLGTRMSSVPRLREDKKLLVSHLPNVQWHYQPKVGMMATLPHLLKLWGHVPDLGFLTPGKSMWL